jgi:diguanylate cyclase (GGDEF)-like protein
MSLDLGESSTLTDDSAAVTDEVTRLCTRKGFLAVGAVLLERYGTCNLWAFLICLKVEQLSLVNHTLGIGAVDLLLARTASLLRDVFRPPSLIGRVGIDEFAVLASVLSSSDCTTLLTRLSDGIDASNASGSGPILTVSGGFCQFDARHAVGIAERMAQAHQAMCTERRRPRRSLH